MNYQIELVKEIEMLTEKQSLLIHSCCAPCSSYVLEYLREYFEIVVFFYNPNITEEIEYKKRVTQQEEFIKSFNRVNNEIVFQEGTYQPECFLDLAKGLEREPEGGLRCMKCYELRLRETAKIAKEQKFAYFTTTLTISPMKNAGKLNEIGNNLAKEYGVKFLASDFKKNNGYKRSIELSKEYDLYRQDYCGCIYSKQQRSKV